MHHCASLLIFLVIATGLDVAALAAPITPTSDQQVIETLSASAASRAADRRLRQALLGSPRDAQKAVQLAGSLMAQAHELGDPRLAGQAMATLQAWSEPASAPGEVLLMQATVLQYLHQFDASAKLLELLLAREPRSPQAWLTLATLRRVQGRYAASDRACARLLEHGAALHGAACQAENAALRGEFDFARGRFERLLADRRLSPGTRNWLLISLAELEQRAGRNEAAHAAFEAALAAARDSYALTAYADFLIDQGREHQALALLRDQPRSDGVLLRLAIAGARIKAPQAANDAREMRERIAQANLRPQAQGVHAREQALFALWVDARPQHALALARTNLAQQREPIDLLLLARAAGAAQQPAALQAADQLRKEIGLHDRRMDALL